MAHMLYSKYTAATLAQNGLAAHMLWHAYIQQLAMVTGQIHLCHSPVACHGRSAYDLDSIQCNAKVG